MIEEPVDEDPDPEQNKERSSDIRPEKCRSPDDHDTKKDKKYPQECYAEAMFMAWRRGVFIRTTLSIYDGRSQESNTKANQPGGKDMTENKADTKTNQESGRD